MEADDLGAAPTPREPRTRTDTMKRLTIILALIAIALAAPATTSQVQAQAAHHPYALTLAQGKKAITHFVEKLTNTSKGNIVGDEVDQCEKYRGSVICEGFWVTAEQKCSAWLGALPTRPIILVKLLTKVTCVERAGEYNFGPSE
jgi:hypothetical protein